NARCDQCWRDAGRGRRHDRRRGGQRAPWRTRYGRTRALLWRDARRRERLRERRAFVRETSLGAKRYARVDRGTQRHLLAPGRWRAGRTSAMKAWLTRVRAQADTPQPARVREEIARSQRESEVWVAA